MALKLTRLAVNSAFLARKLINRNYSLVYNFASNKARSPLILSFLGIAFSKKALEEFDEMSDVTAKIEQADQLFEDNKFQETVDFLKSIENEQSNPEVLWRIGRALFKVSGSESSSSKKAELIRDAYKFIADSLEKDDKNFASHKWYAILLDAKSNLEGVKERIQQLENVQKHMKLAIDLNPEDPTSRYILGEFEFGLADLPWYQRKIVSAIFASPPEGSYDGALENFLKAESLEENFYSMNKLMIGKCYYQLKDFEKAKEFLKKAVDINPMNEDDRKCKSEAEQLLKKIK